MISTCGYCFEGFNVEAYRGVVCGVAVRTPTITQSFLGRLKRLVGGEIDSYTRMSEESHQEAYKDMLKRAKERGANAVLDVRFDTALLVPRQGASEVVCYGTAVIVREARGARR